MQVIGRYALFDEIARGGMATVHLGRLLAPGGFTRTVAVKRLHPHLATDPEFVAMLLDEARLAGRIQHANVVAMLDVVATDGEIFIVMEYVHGETLLRLLRAAARAQQPVAPPLAAALLVNVLEGLHAAHEVRGDRGEPLGLVHRDVTPHNIMVRRDGTALVVDFGVAKAAGRFHTTEEGKIKGKLPYMAPEQVRGGTVTRRTDICAAGAVLWETLVGQRLFKAATEAEVLEQLLFASIDPPSKFITGLPAALDDVVMKALERDPQRRFATAAEMARALEAAVTPALTSQVAAWLDELVGDALVKQEEKLASLEWIALEGLMSPTELVAPIASAAPRPAARDKAAQPDDGAPEPARELEAPPAPVDPPSRAAAAPNPRRALPWLIALGLAVSIPFAWFALRRGEPPPSPEGSGEPRPAGDPAGQGPGAAVPAPPASPTIVSETVEAGAPISSAAPSAASAPVAGASPPAAPRRPSAPPRGEVAPKRPAIDCSVPYTVDAQGRKIYKRECL